MPSIHPLWIGLPEAFPVPTIHRLQLCAFWYQLPIDSHWHARIHLLQGQAALDSKEVPIGCVFVVPRSTADECIAALPGVHVRSVGPGPASFVAADALPDGMVIIARAHNDTNRTCNATRHAEVVALQDMSSQYGMEACKVMWAECTV